MSDTSIRYRHAAHAEPDNAAEAAEPLSPITVTARSTGDVTPPHYGAKP